MRNNRMSHGLKGPFINRSGFALQGTTVMSRNILHCPSGGRLLLASGRQRPEVLLEGSAMPLPMNPQQNTMHPKG